MRALPREFYARSTVTVARALLGKTLVRRIGRTVLSGVITETEAYGWRGDPASHAFGGMTERNRAMFGEVGRAYVYFTYGMHYCVNAVARAPGAGAGAVLIRAISPRRGAEHMRRHRAGRAALADGPAKLTQAMRITGAQYGADLTVPGSLFVTDGEDVRGMVSSGRVGIRAAADRRWNFRARVPDQA